LANSATFLNNRKNLPANFFLANPNLNFARITGNGASSSYNALQMEVRRRFSTGLFLQANYTFSKVLTDSETIAGNDPYRTIRNVGLDRHRANFDITHTFNANWLYDLPIGPGRRLLNTRAPVVSQLLEGWQIQGLINWHTAPYKSILSARGTVNQFSGDNTATPIGDAVSTVRNRIGIFRTPQGVFWINPGLLNVSVNPATEQRGSGIRALYSSWTWTPGDDGIQSVQIAALLPDRLQRAQTHEDTGEDQPGIPRRVLQLFQQRQFQRFGIGELRINTVRSHHKYF
jgi:hypothetical protein